MPRPLLRNVPNTACTEAFAFLYQNKAKEVVGLPEDDEAKEDIQQTENETTSSDNKTK